MSSPKHSMNHSAVPFEVSSQAKIASYVLIVIGAATFIGGMMTAPSKLWPAYLAAFFFFTSLSLGGLFFTAIHHVTNAAWGTTIRRYAEALTSFLPIAFILGMVLVFLGANHLYEWLNPEIVANDPLIQKKVAYLNKPFFIVRQVVFFVIWMLFAFSIVKKSLKQDETGEESLSLKNVGSSIAFLILFALSYSLFSVDLLMSLDAKWYSTMFGVYAFAGLFQSTLAALILVTLWIMSTGKIKNYVNENHVHDVAKLLFAFTVFYAYIAFSQFMLIWYANIPEETEYYLHRAHGPWMSISISLLVFKFLIPFFALMPRPNKRNPKVLIFVCLLLLVMQYVDIYWLIYPSLNDGHPVFSFWEVGMFLGFLGLFLLSVYRFLGANSLVPYRDPRLNDSLHHHI
ncbi:MAG: molybdopterin oxidoreductase [Bdellovibrionales bacterium]